MTKNWFDIVLERDNSNFKNPNPTNYSSGLCCCGGG